MGKKTAINERLKLWEPRRNSGNGTFCRQPKAQPEWGRNCFRFQKILNTFTNVKPCLLASEHIAIPKLELESH